eukprot:COSAG01_NODE_4141_length_5297_cov_78.284973_3_plen_386_part_00
MAMPMGADEQVQVGGDDGAARAGWIRQGEDAVVPDTDKLMGTALGCLPPNSRFRAVCLKLFRNKVFQSVVLVLIVANTVLLAAQGPRHSFGSEFDTFVHVFDIVITVIFTVEMLAGMCALGLARAPNAYLRDWWNVLDFLVVMGIYASALVMVTTGAAIQAGAVRAFRALRPLRSLRLFRGLQSILDALWLTVPYVSTIMGLLSFFLVIFSTMGVALFGGSLSRACKVPANGNQTAWPFSTQPYLATAASERASFTPSVAKCPAGFDCADTMCDVVPADLSPDHTDRTFETEFLGFDDVSQAFLTLLVIATIDEWPLVSHRLWEADNELGIVPWCFVVVVVVVLALVSVNLFTAVVSCTTTFGRTCIGCLAAGTDCTHCWDCCPN